MGSVCSACGKGVVAPRAGPGRRLPYRTLPALELPATLPIPTCGHCGELWLDARTTRKVEAALHEAYREALTAKAAAALETLSKRLPRGELESLLGLRARRLSQLESGGAGFQPALVALLMLLAARPTRLKELRSLWAGGARETRRRGTSRRVPRP